MGAARSYFRRDGLLLVASLGLAVLVWSYVNDELTEKRVVRVPLKLEVPDHLTVAGGAMPTVEVELVGPRGRMASMDISSVRARYRLTDQDVGNVSIKLGSDDFSLPEDVEIAALPERLELRVEMLMRRQVPVKVVLTGKPAQNMVVRDFKASPRNVWVNGREDALDEMKFIPTEEVDVTGARADFDVSVGLRPAANTNCDDEVMVMVEIGREPVPRKVDGIEVQVIVPSGFSMRVVVEDPTISLDVYGDPKELTNPDPKRFAALADAAGLAGLAPGNYELPVRLTLPPEVQLAPGTKAPKVWVRLLR